MLDGALYSLALRKINRISATTRSGRKVESSAASLPAAAFPAERPFGPRLLAAGVEEYSSYAAKAKDSCFFASMLPIGPYTPLARFS